MTLHHQVWGHLLLQTKTAPEGQFFVCPTTTEAELP